MGLWIRPALVLPRQNKKHNIPRTPPKTSCVFLFRAAVCCDTICCENIRKHRFRPPLCEKQRSQLRLKCQTFRTEIQFCIPRELFSDLGQFAFAPQIASVRKQFPSGCKIGSRYEKSDFFRQRHEITICGVGGIFSPPRNNYCTDVSFGKSFIVILALE